MMGGRPGEWMRNRVRTFIYAAEATFLIHALAITYARWFTPPSIEDSGDLEKLGEGLAIKCQQRPRLVGL
jgi:glutathione S-transferase